jgi:hypothetical protein
MSCQSIPFADNASGMRNITYIHEEVETQL